MGNSLEGSVDAYSSKMGFSNGKERDGTTPHYSAYGSCAHNERHVSSFAEADHDQLLLSYFADHPSYPFPLPNGADEADFVAQTIQAWADTRRESTLAETLLQYWNDSSTMSNAIGAGMGDMGTFRLQHVFAETQSSLGGLLARSINAADLLPVTAQYDE